MTKGNVLLENFRMAGVIISLVLAVPAFVLSVMDFTTARDLLELRASQALVQTYFESREAIVAASNVPGQPEQDYVAVVRLICKQREEGLFRSAAEGFLMEVIKTDVTHAKNLGVIKDASVPSTCFE